LAGFILPSGISKKHQCIQPKELESSVKKLLLTHLVLILTSCSYAYHSISEQLSDEMVKDFTNFLRDEEDFQLIIHGGAMTDDIIEAINLGYSSNRYLNIVEARELAIKVSKMLIDLYNRENKIQPFLHAHPFTEKNIQLSIIFSNEKGWIYGPEYISSVLIMDSKIFYDKYNPLTDNFDHIFSENYSEALEKLSK
jgi:hypothetical protein